MQSLWLNRQRFNDYLSKATPGDEAKHIEQILQSLENTITQGKRQPAIVHVTTDKSITDSSYTPPIPPMDKGEAAPEMSEETDIIPSEPILTDLTEDELDIDVL